MTEYKSRRKAVVGAEAIEPDEVAVMVRDAVLAKQFYVFTRDDDLVSFRERFDRILARENPHSPGVA